MLETGSLFQTLTTAQVIQGFGGQGGGKMDRSNNMLEYPESRFQNLRDGFPNG